MMKRPVIHSFKTWLMLALLSQATIAAAQQSQEFGEFVIHYNALNTNLIPPQVAQGYGIKRSSSRVLVNITVIKTGADGIEFPVQASVRADAVNLTGQRRNIEMREIREGADAIYSIGEFSVRNMETYAFKIQVTPEGETQPLLFEFRQQFYTE
jgi:hypothetical protein